MSTNTHTKLCRNCDGYVHIYEMQCPYCGASISDLPEEKKQEASFDNSLSGSMQEKAVDPMGSENFQPPYQYGYTQEQAKVPHESPKNSVKETQDVESPVVSLLLLIPGSVLFLLGLSVALFSTDGVLTFQFRSKFWFVYLIGALPLLYLGYKSLFAKKEDALPPIDHSFTNPLER